MLLIKITQKDKSVVSTAGGKHEMLRQLCTSKFLNYTECNFFVMACFVSSLQTMIVLFTHIQQ